MAVKKLKLEITLQGIHVDVMGVNVGVKSVHLCTADLIWPRGAIARKTTTQTYTLAKGDLGADTLPWGERILFKEDVEGRFAFRLTLSENKSREEIEKFLRSMANTFLGVVADTLGGLFPSPERRLARDPINYVGKKVGTYSGPANFVTGLVDIDPQELSTSQENIVTIPLVASSPVVKTTYTRVGGKRRALRKTILAKDATNGKAEICIRVL